MVSSGSKKLFFLFALPNILHQQYYIFRFPTMFTSIDKTTNDNVSFSIVDSRSIKHEQADQSVIKIRTPNQLNNSLPHLESRMDHPPLPPPVYQQVLRVRDEDRRQTTLPPRRHSVHPNSTQQFVSNRVVVKRLGNTTITTARNGIGIPASIKQNMPAVQQLMSNGNLVKFTTASPQTNTNNIHGVPPTNSDSRDHIIAQLQEQNRELKKALIDIRKESSEIGYRMNRWSSNITQMLNKFNSIQSPQQKPKVKITARKSTSPSVPPPYNFREHSSPPTTLNVVRQQPIRIGQLKQAPDSKLVAYRSPVFPVRDAKILGLLECNLYQTQYFAHVKRNTFNTIQNIVITKPTQMLDSVLKALVHDDLLIQFVLKDDYKPLSDKTKALTWKCYPMVKELFASVVNMMSMRKFNKKVDPQSIEQFLRNKILKNQQNQSETSQPSVSATVTITRTAPQSIQSTSGITRVSPPKITEGGEKRAVIIRNYTPPNEADRNSRSRSSSEVKSDDISNGSNDNKDITAKDDVRAIEDEYNNEEYDNEYYDDDDDEDMFVLDPEENN